MRGLFGAVTGMACLGLSACQYTPGIANQAVAFNEGVADSTNRILVLNALRARERMPTYYTRAASDTAAASVGPAFSLSIPTGPGAGARGYNAGLAVGGNTQHLVGLQNLDDEKFMNGVLAPMKLDVIEFYLGQGWPMEVVLTMAVQRISLRTSTAEALAAALDRRCADRPISDYCNGTLPGGMSDARGGQIVSNRLRDCAAQYQDGGRLTLANRPSDHGETACFKWTLRTVIALGPAAYSVPSYEVVARGLKRDLNDAAAVAQLAQAGLLIVDGDGAAGRYTVCRKASTRALKLSHFAGPGRAAFVTTSGDTSLDECEGKAAAERQGGLEIQFATRSMDGMVYYLGEVLRDEARGNSEASQIWVQGGGQERYAATRLFQVEEGRSDRAPVAVKFQGRRYSVPAASADHRSLQVLALLNQIWGLQKEQAEAPAAAAVIVGG